MKTKIQVAILWLYGWKSFDEECLFKKGKIHAYGYLFYISDAWESQFENL